MSIDEPLFSLDILGATVHNIHKMENCVLRQNKTMLLGRGTLDYIVSIRNDILDNRGYIVPEDWDLEWIKNHGPIWVPDVVDNLETWLTPEYFKPEESVPGTCVEATDRTNAGEFTSSGVNFVQNTPIQMPDLIVNTDVKDYTALYFSNGENMQAESAIWEAGTGDFSCHVVVDDPVSAGVIAAKQDSVNGWTLRASYAGGDKEYIFTLGGTTYTLGEGNAVPSIISCGRHLGFPYINIINPYQNNAEIPVSNNLTDVSNSVRKPRIGRSELLFSDGRYTGLLHELVYYNGSLSIADKLKVQGYLGWKYGITMESSHTYAAAPPRRDSAAI